MKDQIIEILADINPEADLETCTTLVTDRFITSLDMVSLVAELEEEFDIMIPPVEVVTENFDSVDAIAALVKRLLEEDED